MTNYASLEDHDLLLLIQKGEEPAFKEVFHRYWEKLVATGYYYTKNKETTEEIVSDVLMSLWNKREDPAAIRSLPAYLGTAVKYAVFKAIVRQKRREELLQGRLRGEKDHDTEEQLNARFLKDFLEGAVEKLPEKARLVFKYSRDEQLSVSEIAGKMELSSKSVEYHMTKALKALRDAVRKFNTLLGSL
ncbi:MAG TPA: RNA polymerase sigma-70 factor [Puia sp.]|nr:RNA polymerase sigma-70 factor [Puia sp.]